MNRLSFGLIIFLLITACTNSDTSDFTPVLSTATAKPVDTAVPTQAASYPPGMKWYVDTGAVFAATFDKQGYLWTGGFGVIKKWDLDNNSFENFELDGETIPIRILSMLTDNEGIIWASAENGIWKYTDKGFIKSLESPGYRLYLVSTPNGDIIAYGNNFFYVLADGLWKAFQTSAPIESLSTGKDGKIWLVLFKRGDGQFESKGVFQFDGKNFKEVLEFSNTNRLYRVKTCEDNTWFFTGGRFDIPLPAEVIKFDGKEWTKYSQGNWLASNVIELACDKENNLKVFTSEYIMNFKDGDFIKDSYPDKQVGNVIALDKSGGYCLGHYDGIYCNRNGNWNLYLEPGLPDWGILSIAAASDNSIWFGTLDSGTSHFDGKEWKTYTTKEGMPSNWINDIKIDKNGIVWFATEHGLTKFDGQMWSTYTVNDGIIPYSVHSIWIGVDGDMWIGGVMGVSYWDGNSWLTYLGGTFPITQTLSIDVAPNGTAWFGTTDGLVKFDGKSWELYDQADGLPSEWIESVVVTSNKDVWISAASQLTHFDGEVMRVFSREQLPLSGSHPLTVMDSCTLLTADGVIKLYNDEPILIPWKSGKPWTFDTNSMVIAPDNSVWFATFSGALRLSGKEFIPDEMYTGCND